MDFQMILIGIGILIILLVIRYVIILVFSKAEDTVNNKTNEYKSKNGLPARKNYQIDTSKDVKIRSTVTHKIT